MESTDTVCGKCMMRKIVKSICSKCQMLKILFRRLPGHFGCDIRDWQNLALSNGDLDLSKGNLIQLEYFNFPSTPLQKHGESDQSHVRWVLFSCRSSYRKELLKKTSAPKLEWGFYVGIEKYLRIVSCNLLFRTDARHFFKTTLYKHSKFNYSKACLIISSCWTQLQPGFWKHIPLIQEHTCALICLSSHQNSDGFANEGSLFCALPAQQVCRTQE